MWAAYIKTQDEQKILGNHCLGAEYNEDANVAEIDFAIRFAEIFHKDMKYFLGQDFSFDKNVLKLLEIYKEFLVINKGFVESEKNTDIKLPKDLKTEKASEYKDLIEKVLDTKDLSKLMEYLTLII